MWVHIIIFVLTFGTVLVWKAGWIRLDGIADRQSMRLFLLVAVCGNLLGMALTMTDGKDVVYQEGHRMEKNLDGAYTEELEVSVDGRKPQKFDVEIPEKEMEETEVEPEQEVNETEQRQKELKEIIEEYNQQKQDPDYYYLPDQWDGQKLTWQKSGDQTGSLLASLAVFCSVCCNAEKSKRAAGRNGKTRRAATDGLSVTDHEVHTSDSGRNDSSQGVSENECRLYKKPSKDRTICV